MPGDTVGAKFAAGAVNVIYGSASGLTAAGSQRWTQNSRGIPGKAEDEDELARSLAAGHFAGTAYDDLAIGVAVENDYTGAVNIIYGSAKGLTSKNSQILTQATKGMGGAAEKGDLFGVAVASANFGRDSGGGRYDDLAVGIPGEALSRRTSGAGTVQIIYGSRRGLNPANDQIISQASRGILGTAKRADEFGFCLTAHNFNRAGAADLAIGAQGERSLNVVYSTTKGLTDQIRSCSIARSGPAWSASRAVDSVIWGAFKAAGAGGARFWLTAAPSAFEGGGVEVEELARA